MIRWLLVAAMVCVAGAASAAVTVLGNGIARACYEAAKFEVNPATGLKTCNDALAQEPLNSRDRAATYTNRGILRLRQNEINRALADFDRSIGLEPELGQTYINRAAALVQLDRYQEAVDAASKALELTNEDVHAAYFNRAMAYEELGQVENAYHDLQAALAAKPDFEDAQREIARYSVSKG